MDPDALPESDPSKRDFGGDTTKVWKDIWGCGQGIGAVHDVVSAAALVERLAQEYAAARQRLSL
jgi:nitronate monooxygenase